MKKKYKKQLSKKRVKTKAEIIMEGPPSLQQCDSTIQNEYLNRLHEISADHSEKIQLLFEHYNIPFGNTKPAWQALALSLAYDNIPGFQTTRPKGARKKWQPYEKLYLIGRVEQLKQQGKSTNQACRILKDNKTYTTNPERRYQEFLQDPELDLYKKIADMNNITFYKFAIQELEKYLNSKP